MAGTTQVTTRSATKDKVIRLAGGAAGFNWLPVYLAEQRGAFVQAGLRLDIQRLGSVDKATAAVKTGQADIAITPPEGAIKDCAAGGNLRIVASNTVRLPLTLVANAKYKRIESLRGARLGTSSMTEGTALYTMEMLRKHGLAYPGDYEFAVVGVHPARWKALQEGAIEAAVQPPPFNFLAIDAGYTDLGEVSDYISDILFTAVVVNSEWAQENRAPLIVFLKVLMDATRRFHEPAYDDQLIALATEITQAEGKYGRQTIEYLREKHTFERDLSIPAAAFATSLEMMRKAGMDAGLSAQTSRVVDDSFRKAALSAA